MVNKQSQKEKYYQLRDALGARDVMWKIKNWGLYVYLFFSEDPNIMPQIEEIIREGNAISVVKYYWNKIDDIVYEVKIQPTIEEESTYWNQQYFMDVMLEFLEDLVRRVERCGGKK